jgi:transposase
VGWYDRKTRRVRDLSCGDTRIYLEIEIRRVQCRSCGTVKRERLDVLADNPLYTKRFAWYVGRRCRVSTLQDVAKELRLDWHTVKALDKQYMAAQLARAGTPAPKANRRELDSQGPHLSHRGERSDPRPAPGVRGRGSLGESHEPVL